MARARWQHPFFAGWRPPEIGWTVRIDFVRSRSVGQEAHTAHTGSRSLTRGGFEHDSPHRPSEPVWPSPQVFWAWRSTSTPHHCDHALRSVTCGKPTARNFDGVYDPPRRRRRGNIAFDWSHLPNNARPTKRGIPSQQLAVTFNRLPSAGLDSQRAHSACTLDARVPSSSSATEHWLSAPPVPPATILKHHLERCGLLSLCCRL